MQTLKTTEQKNLKFEVSIQGIDSDELRGALKFTIEGIEYGFPADIGDSNISVDVPPLANIVKKLKNESIIECSLDIVGKGYHMRPWQGQFKLQTPVKMEATMVSDSVDITKVTISDSTPKVVIKEETKKKSKVEDEIESIVDKTISESEKKKQKINNKVNAKLSRLNEIMKRVKNKGVVNESITDPIKKVSAPKKRVPIKLDPNKKDHIALMESVGMKKESTQKVMIEKAIQLGGEDNLYATLENLLGVKDPKDNSDLFNKFNT